MWCFLALSKRAKIPCHPPVLNLIKTLIIKVQYTISSFKNILFVHRTLDHYNIDQEFYGYEIDQLQDSPIIKSTIPIWNVNKQLPQSKIDPQKIEFLLHFSPTCFYWFHPNDYWQMMLPLCIENKVKIYLLCLEITYNFPLYQNRIFLRKLLLLF